MASQSNVFNLFFKSSSSKVAISSDNQANNDDLPHGEPPCQPILDRQTSDVALFSNDNQCSTNSSTKLVRSRSGLNSDKVRKLIGNKNRSSVNIDNMHEDGRGTANLDLVRVDLSSEIMRRPQFLLWIVAGVCLGLAAVKVAFASFVFGDPTDMSAAGHMYCAYVCSTVWGLIFSATNISIIYELLIKRVLSRDTDEIPAIPLLWMRFAGGILVGGASCLSLWMAMYQFYGTMVPFHGAISAVFGGAVQGVYFWMCLVPWSFYEDNPELKWKVPLGTLGIVVGFVLVPILFYWAALVGYQLAATTQSAYLPIFALLLFPVARVVLIFYVMYLGKWLLGESTDDLTTMLILSTISILHNSFYCVALESTSGYTAVIFSVVMNVIYNIHRVLVLVFGVNIEWHLSVLLYDYTGWGWSFYVSGHRYKHKGTDSEEERKENDRALKESDRVFYTLEFLSWELFKFVVPLMYLAAAYIIVSGPNAMWMAGLGRVAYQYQERLTDGTNMMHLAQKIFILVGVDLILFFGELIVLQKLKFDLFGFLCFACKEFGSCLCFLLAFMPLNQLCITAVHCGMDFTMKFNWLSDRSNNHFNNGM